MAPNSQPYGRAILIFRDAAASLRLALFILACAWCECVRAAESQTIRVVMDRAYPPYSFESNGGKLQGILVDQWGAWESRTGIKVEILSREWNAVVQLAQSGDFDVIACIVETAERRNYLDFGPPFTEMDVPIFFRSDISGMTDVASLKGFAVGVKAGDQHIDKLKAAGVETITFPNHLAIVEAAKLRKINVFVFDRPSALYFLNKVDIANEFRQSAPIFRDELKWAVREGNSVLLRTVAEGFAAIPASELARIEEKWFGQTVNSHRHYLRYASYGAAFAGVLILCLMEWNRRLRKGIHRHTVALDETEVRFRQIAENIREVFWLVTVDFRTVLYVSPAYENVCGRSCESLYQDPGSFVTAIHPEDRERVIAIVGGDRTCPFEVEYRVTPPDGSICWLWSRGIPIKNNDGVVYRFAGIAEDITERKRSQEKLQETQAILNRVTRSTVLGELSTSIAHEINQPLAAVVTNANASLRWLALSPPNLDEARDAVGRIIRDGARAGEVIARIRHFLTKGDSTRTHLDLNALIQDTIPLMQAELTRHGVAVELDLVRRLPVVDADQVQLQQVLINLVVNAIDSMATIKDRRRVLRIGTDQTDPNGVRVTVRDTGAGIEAEHAELLFRPFYSTKPHGIGMGLAISRSIVESHGGRLITVPGAGLGATFQFTLPVSPRRAQ